MRYLYGTDEKKRLEVHVMVKRVMNPKIIEKGTYIYAVFDIDEKEKKLNDGHVYIAVYDGDETIEYNTSSRRDIVSYTIDPVRANAYKMRNIRKFFAIINNTYGKEFVKEHNDAFRKLIGDINSEIFKYIEKNGIPQDGLIGFEVVVGLDENNEPQLVSIIFSKYKIIHKYKVDTTVDLVQ